MQELFKSSITLYRRALSYIFYQPDRVKHRHEVEITRLVRLLETISQTFFQELIDLQIDWLFQKSSSDTPTEEKERWRQRVQVNFCDSLNKNILEHMPAGYSNTQGQFATAMALHSYFFKGLKSSSLFDTFADMLESIFSLTEKELYNSSWFANIHKEIITFIAWGMQDIVIDVPNSIYKINEMPLTDDDEKRLINILKKIEAIRENYTIITFNQRPDIALPNITTTIRKLKLQIAQVKKEVWLPLRSFVTAPLTREDITLLYVKSEADTEGLARQIVHNDGVILITGYRGVGKSTFINVALSKLAEIEKQQSEPISWHVVPIQISLAKATSVSNVLRLCVRALYTTLIARPVDPTDPEQKHSENYTILLKDDEKKHIRWANLRATYKVNMQQDDSISTLKQLNASMDLKIADLIPVKTIGGLTLGSVLPSFGFKTSKEWDKKVDRTVALLDYDEDQAEDDLVTLIKLFTRTRVIEQGRTVKVKLAFIFDEMDKMDEREGQLPLIQQLKNLFLTRHVVFLLVTSKEFYYLCLSDQKREDAVLSSYFSSVMMMPLFTARDTIELLERMIWMEPDQLASQEPFVESLARYLIYRAKGVPREVIRQLQEMQKWVPNCTQPYLSDTQQKYNIQVYSQIQQALERLVDSEDKTTTAPAASSASSSAEVTIAPERVWMSQERRDQIRRGLYVLVEEMLDRTTLELVALGPDGKAPTGSTGLDPDGEVSPANDTASPDGIVLETIFESNFKTVLPFRFNELVGQLADSLQKIQIEGDSIFSWEKKKPYSRLTVEEAFYDLTGRSASASLSQSVDQSNVLSEEEISKRLSKDVPYPRRRRAFTALAGLQKQTLPASISTQLFRIFLTPNEDSRVEAARYLSGSAFFENAVKEPELVTQFTAQETSEQLLQEFLRLVKEGATDNETRHRGTEMLLDLLENYTKKSKATSQRSTKQITEAIEIICNCVESTNDDVLERVVKCLDTNLDIPKDLLALLMRLAAKSSHNLIELLVNNDFNAVLPDTLENIFSTQSDTDLEYLWTHIAFSDKRGRLLARYVQIAILQQLPRLETQPNTTLQGSVLQWLTSIPSQPAGKELSGDEIALLFYYQTILREAVRRNPRLPDVLERIAEKAGREEIRQWLEQFFAPAPSSSITESLRTASSSASSTPSSTTSTNTKSTRGENVWTGIVVLLCLASIVAYFFVPFDLPAHSNNGSQFITRLLEALYIYGGLVGLGVTLSGLFRTQGPVPTKKGERRGVWVTLSEFFGTTTKALYIILGVSLLIGAIVCFFVQIFFFPFAFTLIGHLVLISLLVLVPLVLLMILGFIVT